METAEVGVGALLEIGVGALVTLRVELFDLSLEKEDRSCFNILMDIEGLILI